jgi:hypothetical protein
MAVVGATVLTMQDLIRRKDPNGTYAKIAELLHQYNPILDHIPWKPSNQDLTHVMSVRTALPTPTWRRFNQGVTPSKSRTKQITEDMGMLESWSELDKDLAEVGGDVKGARASEAAAHIEGMAQEFASTLLYGNHALNQEEFTGIMARYASAASGDTVENVLDAGGAGGDNGSLLLVGWGEESVHGIFPRNTQAGLVHNDLGLQTVQDATGVGTGRLRVYQDHFQWKPGIGVKDWRWIVRTGSFDLSALEADPTGATISVINFAVKMIHRLPNPAARNVNLKFYCPRIIGEMLDVQAMNKTNVYLTAGEEEGRMKTRIRGIEVCTLDTMLENEALV